MVIVIMIIAIMILIGIIILILIPYSCRIIIDHRKNHLRCLLNLEVEFAPGQALKKKNSHPWGFKDQPGLIGHMFCLVADPHPHGRHTSETMVWKSHTEHRHLLCHHDDTRHIARWWFQPIWKRSSQSSNLHEFSGWKSRFLWFLYLKPST